MREKICKVCINERVEENGFYGDFSSLEWKFVEIKSCDIKKVELIKLNEEKFENKE